MKNGTLLHSQKVLDDDKLLHDVVEIYVTNIWIANRTAIAIEGLTIIDGMYARVVLCTDGWRVAARLTYESMSRR